MLEKIQSLVAEGLGVDADKVVPEASFKDDLGADSLDAVELNLALEEKFGVSIDDEAMTGIKTVADIIAYIEKNK